MRIEVTLAADGPGGPTTVSTAVTVDVADPEWPAALVALVAEHASEGARCLAAQVGGATPPTATRGRFVPLADLLAAE